MLGDGEGQTSINVNNGESHNSGGLDVLQYMCRLLETHYLKTYGGLVDYFRSNIFKSPSQSFVDGKLLSKSNVNVDCLLKADCGRRGILFETLIIGDTCVEHCGDNRVPVFIMEQWVMELVPSNSKGIGISISASQLEVVEYLETSPLMAAVKEHGQRRKPKVTHRSCYEYDCAARVGESFLLDIDSSSDFDYTDSNKLKVDKSLERKVFGFGEKDIKRSNYEPCIQALEGPPNSIKRTFTPVMASSFEVVQLCVFTAKYVPSYSLICPLCLSRNKYDEFSIKLNNSYKRIDLSEVRSDTHVNSDSCSIKQTVHRKQCMNVPSFIDLPKDEPPQKETIPSPMVVIADVDKSFFRPSFDKHCCNIPELRSSCDWDDSCTSTLTKKSSKMTEFGQSSPIPLESPPRKQQRVSANLLDSTHKTDKPNGTKLVTTEISTNQRDGTINTVIAEFTMLNVERELKARSESKQESLCIPSLPHKESTISLELSNAIRLEKSKHSFRGAAKKRDHTSQVQKQSDLESLMVHADVAISQSPRPSRRRNAASASAWAASSQHSENTPFFNRRTGLPLQSSPVPLKRSTSGKFDFDSTLCRLKTSKSSTCMLLSQDSSLTNHHSSSKSIAFTADSQQANANQNVPIRRRPASLRFTSGPEQTISTRRRNYPTELNTSEISCSAPPGASRVFQLTTNFTNQPANNILCTPLPHASSQHLLVNFEESMLNGRIHPVGQVEGFSLELGASGSFYPNHVRLPMKAYFFNLSDDNAPSPYLGYTSLLQLANSKGYHVPKKGSIQITLFNPTGLVVKMFVIVYDLEDMPPNCQTFLRQRTVYMPIEHQPASPDCMWAKSSTALNISNDPITQSDLFWSIPKSLTEPNTPSSFSSDTSCSCSSISSVNSLGYQRPITQTHTELPVHLRYLVHLRFHTTRSGKLYLHTDLRLIFSRDKFEFDPRVATYELRSFVDAPSNPRYSPKKWTNKPRHTARNKDNSTATIATADTNSHNNNNNNISNNCGNTVIKGSTHNGQNTAKSPS